MAPHAGPERTHAVRWLGPAWTHCPGCDARFTSRLRRWVDRGWRCPTCHGPCGTDLPGLEAPTGSASPIRIEGPPVPVSLGGFELVIGLRGADLALDDPTVSASHARMVRHQGRWFVEDLGSDNGTFLRLPPAVGHRLWHEARVLLGQPALQFRDDPWRRCPAEPTGSVRLGSVVTRHSACFVEILAAGHTGDVRRLSPGTTWLGRGGGTMVMTGDRCISRRHLRVDVTAAGFWITDWGFAGEGSANGTWLEIGGLMELRAGDRLRLGAAELTMTGSLA